MYRFQVTVNASYLHPEIGSDKPAEIASVLHSIADELLYRNAGLKDHVTSVGEYINWEITETDKEID